MPASLEGKEPSHFCDLPAPWARRCRDFDTYLTLFEKGHRALAVGDASTNYLVRRKPPAFTNQCSEREDPDDPPQRIIAYSVCSFLCFWGLETATTFEAALRREDARYADEGFRNRHELLYYAFLYTARA